MPTNHAAVAAVPTVPGAQPSRVLSRSMLVGRYPYCVGDSENPQDLLAIDPNVGTKIPALLYFGRLYWLDDADATTAHDGIACLVSFDNKRYKLPDMLGSNVMPVGAGGTGRSTLTNHGVLIGAGTGPVNITAAMTDGQLLVGQTGADPVARTITGDVAIAASGVATVAGLNGISYPAAPYVVGDTLYASSTTAMSRLAGVATGNALISGGVGAAPSWGKIGLGSHVSGTLGLGNGGTGANLSATGGASQVLQQTSAGGAITVGQLAASNLSNGVTGSGAVVLAGSPSLTTPTLGVASATSINKVAITAPATSATLTIADGKTLTASNTLTFTGTDGTSFAFPGTSSTVATLGAANAFTGNETHSGTELYTGSLFAFSADGQAAVGASSTDGGLFGGRGSTYDASLRNRAGTSVLQVLANAQTLSLNLGATSRVRIGNTSNYGVISFNDNIALASSLGVFGGATGDANTLYLATPVQVAVYVAGVTGATFTNAAVKIVPTTATPAGGSAGIGLTFGTTTNFGVFFGSGAPTLSAAKGSLYLRSDGTTTNDRAYINTNGSTSWTNLTTGA